MIDANEWLTAIGAIMCLKLSVKSVSVFVLPAKTSTNENAELPLLILTSSAVQSS